MLPTNTSHEQLWCWIHTHKHTQVHIYTSMQATLTAMLKTHSVFGLTWQEDDGEKDHCGNRYGNDEPVEEHLGRADFGEREGGGLTARELSYSVWFIPRWNSKDLEASPSWTFGFSEKHNHFKWFLANGDQEWFTSICWKIDKVWRSRRCCMSGSAEWSGPGG